MKTVVISNTRLKKVRYEKALDRYRLLEISWPSLLMGGLTFAVISSSLLPNDTTAVNAANKKPGSANIKFPRTSKPFDSKKILNSDELRSNVRYRKTVTRTEKKIGRSQSKIGFLFRPFKSSIAHLIDKYANGLRISSIIR